ncbi:metallophosphoesterase (TIGR00282 family) [Bradyrhizobium sp. LM3.2]
MRILFVGDVVGRAGRNAIAEYLPGMVKDWSLDFVVVNGENSAGGFGITEAIYHEFLDAGADAVTLGNHSWDQREALVFIERAERLVRPANYPRGTPGRGAALVETKNGKHALVVNALGRVFMTPFDDPFAALERELGACPLGVAADAIVVDFHCEASSEKQGIGFFCDGRASLVVGTHTHVPTADHQILSGGTGLHDRCRHDRRLRLHHRYAEGGAAAEVHVGHSVGPVRAGSRGGDAERRRGGDG